MRRTLVLLTSAIMLALALVPGAAQAASKARSGGCDPLDTRSCLLPWPSNAYTVPDARTDTGRRVNLLPGDMPKNAKGRRIDPLDVNRADGFSPGSSILTHVPGLSLKRTGATPVTDLGATRFRRGRGGRDCVPRCRDLVNPLAKRQLPTLNWHSQPN